MTVLLWEDKPGGGRMDCQADDGDRELVQALLPGKGDEARQTAFSNPVSSPSVVLPCPPSLRFLSPAAFPASTS